MYHRATRRVSIATGGPLTLDRSRTTAVLSALDATPECTVMELRAWSLTIQHFYANVCSSLSGQCSGPETCNGSLLRAAAAVKICCDPSSMK